MDEFLIELQAKLDEAKSKGNVNADINKLQNELNKLKVQVELDPKSAQKLADDIGKLINQKITISNIGIDTNKTIKTAQQTGQQIGNAINQGVTNAVSKAGNALKSFSDLRSFSELNKSINNFHVDTSELKNYKSILNEIKTTYAEFGQVRITNEIFKDGVLEKFKVNIEQVNGDLKETKSFMMSLNDEKDAFLFSGLISGSESVVQHLDKTKDAVNQTAEAINALKEKAQIDKIQLSMDNGYGASEYQNRINAVTASLEKYGVETQEAKNITASLQSTFDSMKGMSGQDLVTQADKLEQEFKAVKVSVDQAKLSYDKYMQPVSNEKATSLINRINSFLTKNTKITNDAKVALQGYIDELSRGVNLSRWNEINGVLKKTENSMRGLGRLGTSLKDQMSQAAQSFTQWLSVSSAVMMGVSKTKEAISELIELDSILTEISKTSDLTNQQLRELGNTAFDSASKYGRSAADYLTGVQEMYRAGFKNAEEMAELSLLAQAAGDMESNSANDYLMATNAAYNYKGSVEELNKVLDSQNYITNNAAVSMQDMADATSEAASIAAQYGVEIDELSALIAVATSKTRESGSEVGTALKSIFVTLQDTTSKPVVEAFDAVGISMTKIVNGSEQLKTPIELLKELSVAFNELPEGDTKRANILTDIGKKYHANTLSAILSDWESYESMLELYSQGIGSAANEAEKSANNIEGSLNRLSNTWTDTIENILNSDAILTVVKALNGLLSVINNVTDKLGSLGTIGLGAGLFAGVKNSGVRKCVLFICFCFEYALFSQEMTISRVEMCGFSQPTRVLK